MNDQAGPELPDNNRHALRRVARGLRKASLATSLAASPDGRPYVSLVTVAFDHDLSPILLLSRLADHTRNLLADPRAALLLDGTEGHANPQTGPRVTLVGTAVEDDEPRLKARFLALHPGAALYAGFADFSIWRLRLERAHFVAGFGRAVWFDAPLVPEAEAMAACEAALVAEVNAGRAGDDGLLLGIDADGCDLAAAAGILRLAFSCPVDGEARARGVLAGIIPVSRGLSTR
ncbi:MAG: pyridoxamine 5'-phosphate oxidase family protein [Phaeospirillum sp.]|nr:pyridoxamine 5'-phosphate oxidase family protein [Phaeospirillum sp.]